MAALPLRDISNLATAAKDRPMRAPHAGRMTCSGRSPGSRVITPPRLPGPCPKSPVAYRRRTHRLQFRAQLRICPAIAESKPHRIPFADQYDQRPKHGHSKLTRAPCQGVKILAILAATNLLKSAL